MYHILLLCCSVHTQLEYNTCPSHVLFSNWCQHFINLLIMMLQVNNIDQIHFQNFINNSSTVWEIILILIIFNYCTSSLHCTEVNSPYFKKIHDISIFEYLVCVQIVKWTMFLNIFSQMHRSNVIKYCTCWHFHSGFIFTDFADNYVSVYNVFYYLRCQQPQI